MAKVFNYIILISGLLLLLALAGFPTLTNELLAGFNIITLGDAGGDASGFNFNLLPVALAATVIAGIFAAAALTEGTEISIGIVSTTVTESKIVAGLCSALFAWIVADMVSIINLSLSYDPWIRNVIILIVGPMILGLGIAMVSFWRGSDS